jgi:hypothetical protein
VGFRDSKLTRILQSSLLGRSLTAIICCVSQTSANLQETLQTLYFGQKARNIRTQADMNEVIRESPDQIAHKMATMTLQIDSLNGNLAKKDD